MLIGAVTNYSEANFNLWESRSEYDPAGDGFLGGFPNTNLLLVVSGQQGNEGKFTIFLVPNLTTSIT